jgi:hypothetical protein
MANNRKPRRRRAMVNNRRLRSRRAMVNNRKPRSRRAMIDNRRPSIRSAMVSNRMPRSNDRRNRIGTMETTIKDTKGKGLATPYNSMAARMTNEEEKTLAVTARKE